MPEDLEVCKAKTFGMQLIVLLAETQLMGHVDVRIDGGTEFLIQFQELHDKARI